MSRKSRLGFVLVLLCFVVIALGGHAQDKIPVPRAIRQARASLHLQNGVLNLYCNERNSDTWLFQYSPGEWGESCYHEHFAIWTPEGIRESDEFLVTQEFTTPSGGSSTCIVTSPPFEVIRAIELDPGSVNFFDIIYLVKNVGGATQNDVRFFQAIDFDIPDTGDCTDDYGQYDSGDRKTWIVDYEFFRNTVTATPLPDQHGLDHWSIEIWDDWDDGVLNERSWYGPGDPGLTLRFNLGNMQPGQQKEVRIRVSFDVAAAADLQVNKVEINQAFQDKDVEDPDAVPLVAGKPAVVRAFVDIGSVDGPVLNVTGELHILKDGTEIAGSPFSPVPGTINAPKNPDRQEINDTLNFYVGSLGKGEYDAYVILDPENDVFESNDNNNRYPTTGYFSFGMDARSPANIMYYELRQDGIWPLWSRMTGASDWLRKTYPTDTIGYWYEGAQLPTWCANADSKPCTVVILLALSMRLGLYNLANDPDAQVVCAWMSNSARDVGSWYGVTNPNIHSILAYDHGSYYPNTLAHEVGHNYGLNLQLEEYLDSTATPIGEGGFDVIRREVIDSGAWNFMNNRMTSDTWVSRDTYLHLYNALSPTRIASRELTSDFVLVSGAIDQQGDATLHPIYRLAGTTVSSQFSGGEYALEFRDSAGIVLASYSFTPDFGIRGIEEPVGQAAFSFIVPFPSGTAAVAILRGGTLQSRQVLAQQTVSEHVPSVTVLQPNGGEMLAGTVSVQWNGTDVDGDHLTYSILYSHDGSPWHLIAQGIDSTSFNWDTTSVPGGDQCHVRVLATDGVNTNSDQSDNPFSVDTKLPTAVILSPINGGAYQLGEELLLHGVGHDLEDGALSGQLLEWTSDQDGQLGSGETMYTSALSEGQHTIALTATDSDGGTSTDTITVTVVRDTAAPPPPTGLQTNVVGSFLQLTWIPSVADDVAGYILHFGEAPGDYYLVRDIGNVTQWETDDLAVGRTYYLALSAYDRVRNEGVLSDEVVATYALECTVESTTTGTIGWHMISLPGELCSPCLWAEDVEICGDLVCALCDDLDPCFVFYYDPEVGGYVMAPPANSICYHAGIGFWTRTYLDDITIDAEVQVPTETLEVSLQNGWNQIGNPFTFAVAASALRVRCGDTELSLTDAQAQGWVSAYLFGYDTASGGYVMIDPTTGSLQPWSGYWMRSYRDDCILVIPPTVYTGFSTAGQPLSTKELQARGLELPPPPPNDLMNLDVKEVLAGLTVRNVPNPIRSEHTTTFKVEGKGAELVQAIRVEIYDQSGQRMFTQDINAQELEWHTKNDTGELLANGVYLYQVWVKIAGSWYPTGVRKLAVVR